MLFSPVTSDNTIIRNLIIDASCSFKGTGRNAAFISACNWDEWGSRKVELYNCGNEGQSEMQWFQTLGTDLHPIPLSSSLPVYRNGNFYCDGRSKGNESFSNTEGANYDPHQFSAADDLCNVCLSGREPGQADGIYQIGSIGNLVWFASTVNTGAGISYSAVLTADIRQGRAVYTPIGSAANAYRGHFDGQTHSITLDLGNNAAYDYQGIFGVITDGVHIANLVARGTITGRNYVGGIAGGTNGGSNNAAHTLLENCGNEDGCLEPVTKAQVVSGQLCDLLNSDGTYWYQNDDDTYPLPFEHSYVVTLIGEPVVTADANPFAKGYYHLNGQRLQTGFGVGPKPLRPGIYILHSGNGGLKSKKIVVR